MLEEESNCLAPMKHKKTTTYTRSMINKIITLPTGMFLRSIIHYLSFKVNTFLARPRSSSPDRTPTCHALPAFLCLTLPCRDVPCLPFRATPNRTRPCAVLPVYACQSLRCGACTCHSPQCLALPAKPSPPCRVVPRASLPALPLRTLPVSDLLRTALSCLPCCSMPVFA